MDTIPNYWEFKTPILAHKDVLVFRPIYGPSQTRGFGDGSPIHNWELGADDSSHAEFSAMKAFWDARWPGISFWLDDPQLDEKRTYEFDSDFSYHYNNPADSYSWKVRIKEVYPYVVTP